MASKLLTDVELRAHFACSVGKCITIDPGTILTPAAKDFVREQGITLVYSSAGAPAGAGMPRTKIPVRDGKAVYVDAATGRELAEKGENMTHLRGNILIPKTDPRIAFRGKLDSLQALIMEIQLTAESESRHGLTEDLDDVIGFVRKILAAEVKDEPLGDIRLLGRDSARLRYDSHHVKEVFGIDHPVFSYRMGRLCVCLNTLRTRVREAELAAAYAFTKPDGSSSRPDIIEALNRLSSAVYILICRTISERK